MSSSVFESSRLLSAPFLSEPSSHWMDQNNDLEQSNYPAELD
jgi:hypothetical protein